MRPVDSMFVSFSCGMQTVQWSSELLTVSRGGGGFNFYIVQFL